MLALFAQIPTQENVDTFFSTGIGLFISNLAKIAAVLIVLYGIWQTGKGMMQGRGAGAAKSLIGCLVVAAFFFNLQWTVDLMQLTVKAVNGLFETLKGV